MTRENYAHNLVDKNDVLVVLGDTVSSKHFLKDNDKILAEISDPQNEFIQVHFKKLTKINCVVLKEKIKDGQSVERFYIQLRSNKKLETYMYSTIGQKRIMSFPAIEVDDLFIYFPGAKELIKITGVEAYLLDEKLIEK